MAIIVAGLALALGTGILYVLYALFHLPRYICGKSVLPLVLGGIMWAVSLVADRKMAAWE